MKQGIKMEIKSAEQMISDLLSEQATSRKDANLAVFSLSHHILHHLIKILKWDDEINFNKHKHDINYWLGEIQDIRLKPSNKKMKESEYYKGLLTQWIEDEKDFNDWIVKLSRDYGLLKVLRNDNVVYENICSMIKSISRDLSKDEFQSISKYM